jgi:hypothetical protein
MMMYAISQLLFSALVINFGLHYPAAIAFSINPSEGSSIRSKEQRSTFNHLIAPNKQLRVPAGSTVCPKASNPATILDLKMVHTVYWFRKALRVHDNPSLIKSIVNATNLDPIFCLDPWFVKSGKVGVNRMGFLLESLTNLDQSLRKVGSKLIIVRGDPVEEIPKY